MLILINFAFNITNKKKLFYRNNNLNIKEDNIKRNNGE